MTPFLLTLPGLMGDASLTSTQKQLLSEEGRVPSFLYRKSAVFPGKSNKRVHYNHNNLGLGVRSFVGVRKCFLLKLRRGLNSESRK